MIRELLNIKYDSFPGIPKSKYNEIVVVRSILKMLLELNHDNDFLAVSRKKFALLSRMFTRGGTRRAGSARAPTRGLPDSLLLQEEHSDDDDRPHNTK